MRLVPVILSGGSGTRLWPVSRTGYPKQLQALHGEKSLLQQTALRLAGIAGVLPPLVLCNDQQRFLVAEQLREEGIELGPIILEPVARSTAPALAVAALSVEKPDETVLVIMPADHFIADRASFQKAIGKAAALAMKGKLMTLGIKPTTPHTGFGYIEQGAALAEDADAFAVTQFKEKPGGKLSLQKHHHRAEHWIVVSGTAKVQCGEDSKLLGPNESVYIPLGEKHRLENPGLVPLFLIEVQSGDYLGEDDIVRFEDIYQRNN